MIFGMTTYTFIHVLISLIAILYGFIAVYGLLTANRMEGITLIFLVTTVATSATGFGFPFNGFTPAIGVGTLSLVVLAVTLLARYKFRLLGASRWIYVVGAMLALYFNTFVLVVQLFLKIPALHALAPQGTEPPFAITQGVVLLVFVVLGILSVRRFHPVRELRF